MEKRISATHARRRFGEMMSRVARGESLILEKSGEPMAAVVPMRWYEQWMERREAEFAAFVQSRSGAPSYPEAEVEADIAEAIREVRAQRRLARDDDTG